MALEWQQDRASTGLSSEPTAGVLVLGCVLSALSRIPVISGDCSNLLSSLKLNKSSVWDVFSHIDLLGIKASRTSNGYPVFIVCSSSSVLAYLTTVGKSGNTLALLGEILGACVSNGSLYGIHVAEFCSSLN